MPGLREAEDALDAAERGMREAIAATFPIGMAVVYRRGGGYGRGVVQGLPEAARGSRYLLIEHSTTLTRERRRLCKKMMFWHKYTDVFKDLQALQEASDHPVFDRG